MMKSDELDDDDFDNEDEIDEHELEAKASGGRKINWRRVELLKERMRLKEDLSDFEDYPD